MMEPKKFVSAPLLFGEILQGTPNVVFRFIENVFFWKKCQINNCYIGKNFIFITNDIA